MILVFAGNAGGFGVWLVGWGGGTDCNVSMQGVVITHNMATGKPTAWDPSQASQP
jgi:hypothetical protein